jgi:hypothetical protein
VERRRAAAAAAGLAQLVEAGVVVEDVDVRRVEVVGGAVVADHDRQRLQAADVDRGVPRYSGKGTTICVPSLLRNRLPS